MSRKPSLSPELRCAFMESPGSVGRAEGDFLELEPDEELLCSVSDITEHLGRNITVVLETALSEIRKMVSLRIRVLKMELRQKTEEIHELKARLETVHGDARDAFPGSAAATELSAEPGFKKHSNNNNNNSNNNPDPRRAKAAMPGVKKENINAICDYLMKDKNSRGCADVDGDQGSDQASGGGGGGDREARSEPEPHSLHLWPDNGMVGSGPADDIFGMLPSGSKRLYDYEWIAPMEYSADAKVGLGIGKTLRYDRDTYMAKEPECENHQSVETEDDDDNEDESSRREAEELEEAQAPLSIGQPSDFSMEAPSSPEEGGSSLEGNADRPETGQQFTSHPYICSLCGTFCPDSLFLEEHVKLIHLDSAGGQGLQALQSTSSSSSSTTAAPGMGDGGKNDLMASGGTGQGEVLMKKEIKIEGGYQCGECGRHFNYLGNLRQHQRIHTGEKPFMCPECGERFRHAARLKSHRLVHSGAQSPFPCPQCGKGFSVLSGLKRHQRVHTGESPYACPQCGRRFKELGNLYTHQRIHSGATPYCCQQCGRSFRHLGTYKSHRCTPAQ